MPRTLTPTNSTAARAFAAIFQPGQRVCLTTHVNPDGDGLGSEEPMPAQSVKDRLFCRR